MWHAFEYIKCSCAFSTDAIPRLVDKFCRYTCLRVLFLCLQGINGQRCLWLSLSLNPYWDGASGCLPFAVQGALEYPRHLDLVRAACIDLVVLMS